jgi:hypothetical protein
MSDPRAEFEAAHGYWDDVRAQMLERDPVFFEAWVGFSTVAH